MYFTDINNREGAKKYCADVMCKVQRERANDDVIKTDEFLEKFQTALTPPSPPHIAIFQYHAQKALFKGPKFAM